MLGAPWYLTPACSTEPPPGQKKGTERKREERERREGRRKEREKRERRRKEEWCL